MGDRFTFRIATLHPRLILGDPSSVLRQPTPLSPSPNHSMETQHPRSPRLHARIPRKSPKIAPTARAKDEVEVVLYETQTFLPNKSCRRWTPHLKLWPYHDLIVAACRNFTVPLWEAFISRSCKDCSTQTRALHGMPRQASIGFRPVRYQTTHYSQHTTV